MGRSVYSFYLGRLKLTHPVLDKDVLSDKANASMTSRLEENQSVFTIGSPSEPCFVEARKLIK